MPPDVPLTLPPLPRILLFDMDGTLTAPLLDFPRIKAEMGIGQQPILEALAALPPDRRCAAEQILHRHEARAAEESTLNPGCLELLAWLAERNMPTALITRNSRRSVNTVVQRHGLKIDVLITREDCVHKPSPAPLLLALRRLGFDADSLPSGAAWMVGDGVHDIEAARAAGVEAVWLSHHRTKAFAAEPDRIVATLPALQSLLEAAWKRELR
jgi:HAD superfamily hydrolase (TIGR01549 family)